MTEKNKIHHSHCIVFPSVREITLRDFTVILLAVYVLGFSSYFIPLFSQKKKSTFSIIAVLNDFSFFNILTIIFK